ncbi:MAG: hypothetical protein F6K19_37370 [Cyanothece sp. SIO1E1]|nr:hypothetical protein [Cyanothece sp. SIO1E1]
MAQASSWQYRLDTLIQAMAWSDLEERRVSKLSFGSAHESWRWLLGLGVIGVLLLLNWRLVLASMIGLVTTLLVYSMHSWRWSWLKWQRWFNPANRPLTLALVSGAVALTSTYLIISIWIESEHHWIATGLILQGTVTLLILALLGWQMLNRATQPDEKRLELMLGELTHTNSLNRLIAVRKITGLATRTPLNQPYARGTRISLRSHLTECFRLMLSQESNPLVHNAILDGLRVLHATEHLQSEPESLPLPRVEARSPLRIHHRVMSSQD